MPSVEVHGRQVTYAEWGDPQGFPVVVLHGTPVADHLEVERFAVSGASGGGPHALAVAALCPGRVVRCRVTSCLAPAGIPGFFEGMEPHNVEEWELVTAMPHAEVIVWEDLDHLGDVTTIFDDYRALVHACRT